MYPSGESGLKSDIRRYIQEYLDTRVEELISKHIKQIMGDEFDNRLEAIVRTKMKEMFREMGREIK